MTATSGIVIGVDASRNRSGGAKAHLIGLIESVDPRDFGIREVHVWAYRSLLDVLPNRAWLVCHSPAELEKSLPYQVFWQVSKLPGEARDAGCHILLNTDAGTLSRFRPCVTMSRDMLSYEEGEIERYGWSKARLRLILLRYIQNRSLRRASGAIFLTQYAADVIQNACGLLDRIAVIPHGVGENFRENRPKTSITDADKESVTILYVSNVAWYKHQWHVVEAIGKLRTQGYNVTLVMVGGGHGAALERLNVQMEKTDPKGEFTQLMDFVPHGELPGYLEQSDIFVFASSCENMPNTLVEAMASGLPIACSDRGPMPEVLQDGGEYFDPEDSESILQAVIRLVKDPQLQIQRSARAMELANLYSWERCASETYAFLVDTYNSAQAKKVNSK